MASNLAAMSGELAAAVERAGRSVVAVHGRRRWASGGVVWRPGVVVTAEHTLRRDEEITLTLPDGTTAAATLAGRDSGADLAVLRTEAALEPLAQAASSGLRPGHLALAIGRSADSGVNASLGIVSAIGPPWRTWRGGQLDSYLRLDLTFFPGTSGGAVVNTAGEAIGIATSALSRIAGLAIPSSNVDRTVDELLRRGRIARGYLGVGVQPVDLPEHQKNQIGVGSSAALIVISLEPGGPAAAAGVLVGDILCALDGKPVSQAEHIQAVLESKPVGDQVSASILRGGVAATLSITIGERPRRA